MIGLSLMAMFLTPPSLDVRVDGPGYLRFVRDGRAVYATSARLMLHEGRLAHERGYPLLPTVSIAPEATDLAIDRDGTIRALFPEGERVVGRLRLARFQAGPLVHRVEDLFVSPDRPLLGYPGEDGFGVIASGPAPKRNPEAAPAQTSPSRPSEEPAPASNGRATRPGSSRLARPDMASSEANPPALGRPALPSVPADPTSIRLAVREHTEVATTQFTLGDVADILAPAEAAERLRTLILGDTPALGVERLLDPGQIRARLKAAGFDVTAVELAMPARAVVARRGQRISHERFVEVATEAARRTYGDRFEITGAAPGPEMVVPEGSLTLTPERVTGTNREVTVSIGVAVDGKRFNSRTVRLLVDEAPTAALRVGQTVTIRVKSNDVVVLTQGTVRRIDALQQTVQVQTREGVAMVGKVAKDGVVEVNL